MEVPLIDQEDGYEESEEEIENEDEHEHEHVPLSDIPIDNRRITCDQVDFTIKNLYDLEQDGDLTLQPDFQRNYVWKVAKASRLIESVLINVPIPVIYLSEEGNGILSVIDGQQRLTGLIEFLKGAYKLRGITILSENNGKTFSQLEPELQRRIKNTPIRSIILKKESHPDIKFEIFERLNTGSVKLNEQELRNCVYRGSLNQMLKEISEEREWLNVSISKSDRERMKDREMILRFIAFYSSYNRYGSSLKQFLNRFMDENRNATIDQLNEYKRAFRKSLLLSKTVFGEKTFRRFSLGDTNDPNGKWEEVINKALFDTVMLGFVPYEQNQIVPIADSIREGLLSLLTTEQDFIDSITSGTGDKRKVRARIDIWSNKLRYIVNNSLNNPRAFSREFRKELYDQNPVCEICGQKIMLFDDTSVDHTVPFSLGGATTPSNARLTHRFCNSQRGNR